MGPSTLAGDKIGDGGDFGIAIAPRDTPHDGAGPFITAEGDKRCGEFALVPARNGGTTRGALAAWAMATEAGLCRDGRCRARGLRLGEPRKRA